MDWLRRAAVVVRRVIGVPDYERYVTHMRKHHPQLAPLSREQFIAGCLQARYEKPGSRCC
jgi:uncharacterized short protein YbdD (DUF466 family)